MGPNIIQQENRMRRISDEALREMLLRMSAQPDKMSTPGFLLVAGEIQSRKDARAKAAATRGNPKPVIADLLTDGAMPPQMPTQTAMLPEDAGGVAALPAPNMDNVAELAAGGLVAFDKGGSVKRKFEALPRYVGEEAGIPGAELSGFFKSQMRGDVRVDPVTGKPVTFGEFMRLEDERAAAAARTPAVQAIPTGVAATPQVQNVVSQPTSFMDGLLNAASPGIPGTSQLVASAPPSPSATGMPTGTAALRDQVRLADNAGLPALRQQAGAQQDEQQGMQNLPPRPAPVASAAVPPLDISRALTQGTDAVKGLMGEAPKVPAQTKLEDIKKAYSDEQQLFKDLGIPDPTQMRREQLDEEIKNAKSEKTQAGWRWLANFGATWAATGGPTLQAMGKSGEKTLPGLMDDIKDINKLQRDQRKELAGLAALDAQAKRDMTAKARDRLNSERARAEDRLDNYNKQITTLGASIGGQLVQRDTSLQVAKIGADSRSADIDAVERRIAAMPGKTYAERLTNYYKAITPRYASETSELDKTAAALAKDPAKLEALKATNPALYAIMIQRINALSVPTATDQATGRVRD